MPLFRDNPGNLNYVTKIDKAGVQIGEETHPLPLIVSPTEIRETGLSDPAIMSGAEVLNEIFELKPELVIIGSGSEQHFLAPETMMEFYKREIGIEVMKTEAACRTFNILVVENRKVVALLLPIDQT